MEERLPMMALLMPPSFRRQFSVEWRNLRRNAEVLASPFDVHQTLRHLLRLTTGSGETGSGNSGRVPTLPSDAANYPRDGKGGNVWRGRRRGRGGEGEEGLSDESYEGRGRIGSSLLRRLPADRLCLDAGIETHWCTCLETTPLAPNNAYAVASARAVLDSINAATYGFRRRCAEWQLKALVSAARVRPNEGVLRFRESRDADHRIPDFRQLGVLSDVEEYRVTLTATPVETPETAGVTPEMAWKRGRGRGQAVRNGGDPGGFIDVGDESGVDGAGSDTGGRGASKFYDVEATFEATVRVHLTDDEYVVEGVGGGGEAGGGGEWTGNGISRLDRYGDQPACIQKEKPHLRKFCFCRF